MKILMQNRSDAQVNAGGDTIQMLKTKEYLEKLGCQVELSFDLEPRLDGYDLVHLFNVTQVHETYLQFLNAKNQRKPVVLSPIYQNFDELDKKAASGAKGLLWRIFGKDAREAIKTCVRALLNPGLLRPALIQLQVGFTRQQLAVLGGAALLLPNSDMEAGAIRTDFNIQFDYVAVPNAIDTMFCRRDDTFTRKTGLKDYVLCVGNYIERKNQLSLIKALQGLNLTLVLVGAVVPTHKNYYAKVQAAARQADFPVKIYEKISQAELVSIYWGAKVIALPSWIETTGLACLEGGLAGCNVVITDRGYAREYFRDMALYCSPDDVGSIREAVRRACQSRYEDNLREHILKNFTWEKTAAATREGYHKILGMPHD
jgi:glycosyltransferase involved in cell wall biosynthesis